MVRRTLTPRALGVVAGLAGVGFLVWGHFLGALAGIGLGGGLLAAVVLDLVALLILTPRAGASDSPLVTPNPVQAGETITVILPNSPVILPQAGPPRITTRCQTYDPWRGDWPDAMAVEQTHATARDAATMTARYRGKWDVGRARWTTVSPLALWQFRRHDDATSELTVWPAVVDIDVPPPSQTPGGSAGLGPLKPQLDDTTLREYVPGDDLHRVHWRSLARTNTLMTRAEEPSSVHRTVGALSIAPTATADAIDLGISLLASWGMAMIRGGHEFAIDVGEGILRKPTRGQMMEALTQVGAPASPDVATDAGDGLVVVVAGPSDDQPAVAVPQIAASAVAVVIAPPGLAVPVPAGWLDARINPNASLEAAAEALERTLFAVNQAPLRGRAGARR